VDTGEPLATGWFLATIGVLIAVGAFSSRLSGRFGLPFYLVFLGIGMLAGENGPGGIVFEGFGASYRMGTLALVMILFDGGLNTSLATVRRVALPAAALATAGVAAIAAGTALAGRACGLPWPHAVLVGAIVSSTDAAAVFAQLRGARLGLRDRVAATIEVESGVNDPMAVLLTIGVTQWLAGETRTGFGIAAELVLQFGVGALCGWAIGRGAAWLLRRFHSGTAGLYPVITVSTALVAYGVPTLLHGSGLLAVYLAGIVLGGERLPYRAGLIRIHDAGAWLSQVGMFLLLGLLVSPGDAVPAVGWGIGVALLLTFLVRPAVVTAFLVPFGYRLREALFIGWAGLRGAVPIVLSIFPVLAGIPGGREVFHGVFFIVIVSAVLPGATLPWAARRAGLAVAPPPVPRAVLEMVSTEALDGEVASFFISPALAVAGAAIRDVPFPEGASVLLVNRGARLMPARGSTLLEPGDHVFLFYLQSDRPLIELLFGSADNAVSTS
jgi:cell volume regulation protein A